MKAIALTLTLMLCLIGFVDSKLLHELSRRDYQDETELALNDPGRENEVYKERDYYNSRYADSDEYKSRKECQRNLDSCDIPLMSKYNTRDNWAPIAIPLRIRLAGARAICRDGIKFGRCVKSNLDQPVCQRGLAEHVKSSVEQSLNLGQKLCVDRIDDFAKHWHCILSLRVYTKLSKCAPRYGREPGSSSCDTNEIIDCVVNAYGSIPDCEAGATDFIKEFLPEVLHLGGLTCRIPGGPRLARSLQKILKIK